MEANKNWTSFPGGVSKELTEFLHRVGLPRHVPNLFAAEEGAELMPLGKRSELLIVGRTDGGDPLCMDKTSGRVVWFREDPGESVAVNSSIQQLANCLEEYEQCRLRAEGLKSESGTADEQLELVAELRQKLGSVDPSALGDEESFWNLILSELEMAADGGSVTFN